MVTIFVVHRMTNLIEEAIAAGQPLVSVALMETYVRLLLVSPQSLYRKLLEVSRSGLYRDIRYILS